MMYQACRSPGSQPSIHRRMLMMESTEQMPRLTQTARGGKRMAMRPRKMSGEHIFGGLDDLLSNF
jgi:hypothetical protein